MKGGTALIGSIVTILSLSETAHSTIWHVHPDSAISSIQAGIDSSSNGDTVLVYPETYLENVNFSGKNIVLGSLFLTTGDTSYITSTIIDGDSSGSVMKFENGEDSSAVLTGFTIQNGYAEFGGGIYCRDNSSPSLTDLEIGGNTASGGSVHGFGGGIYCGNNSSPSLINVTIRENAARGRDFFAGFGGGIYCDSSSPSLVNVTISGNTALMGGGGIHCVNDCAPSLASVTITENTAGVGGGGGIRCMANSSPRFDSLNRCNVFFNSAASGTPGCDFCAYGCPIIDVIVDTFTVLHPNEYFASPVANFTFDILNAKLAQVSEDLYVSPTGSNDNSGLTSDEPLRTIHYALMKIHADSTNPHTIHLAHGTYSASQTGEVFPLLCRSHVSLQGEIGASAILDAEGHGFVLGFVNSHDLSVENMSIQNGSHLSAGGIACSNSSPDITNVTISRCHTWTGGGIACFNSSPNLTNVTISGNTADVGGGVYCYGNSSPSLVNCVLWDNSPEGIGVHSGSPSVVYSDIQGGWLGTGNIDADPLFIGSGDHPLSLQENSPCIDAGTPDTSGLNLPPWDIIGNVRIWDGDGDQIAIIDMGAYEYGAPPVGIKDKIVVEPAVYSLHQNYPNPFNLQTTIRYGLAQDSRVSLKVYSVLGQQIRVLVNKFQQSGMHRLIWDGRDNSGRKVSSGPYFLRLRAGDHTATRKLSVMR